MNNYNLEQDVFNWLEAAGFERGDASMQETAIHGFYSEVAETMTALQQGDMSEFLDGFIDTDWMLANLAYFGIDKSIIDCAEAYTLELAELSVDSGLTYALDEIQQYKEAVSISNWSKFCESEAEALQTVSAYFNAEHPDKLGKCILSYHRQINNKWVVFNSATRKVLKSINYITVQDALKTL